MMAFEEVKPAFGAVRDTLESYRLNGIIDYGESFQHLTNTCNSLVEQARTCASLMSPPVAAHGWKLSYRFSMAPIRGHTYQSAFFDSVPHLTCAW